MKWIHRWGVLSSKSDKTYTVSLADDGTFGCSCLAWTRRRIECRHIKEVKHDHRAEIERAAMAADIPLIWDDRKHDFVLSDEVDGLAEAAKIDPSAERIMKKLKDRGKKKSLAEELDEELAKLDSPAPEKLKATKASSVLSLIQKNAEWRI